MTTALSRRSLFTTSAAALAASTVTAAPAVLASMPIIMPAAAPEVDARLWELARALGPMEQEWFEACETHNTAEFAYFKQVPKRPEPFEGAAAEEWRAVAADVAERVGYNDTKEAQEEARQRVNAIHDELWDLTAATMVGIQAKAHAVRTLAFEQDFEEYAEEFYANNGKSPESMALMVVRDLLRMMAPLKS